MRSSKEHRENLKIELLYEPSEGLTVNPEFSTEIDQAGLVSVADNHQRTVSNNTNQEYVDVEYLDDDTLKLDSKLEESSVISNQEHEGTFRCTNCEKCRR